METKSIKLESRIPREAESIPCPKCNGFCDKVNLTKEELEKQCCGKKNWECCGRAFICRVCKTRFSGDAESPEMDY